MSSASATLGLCDGSGKRLQRNRFHGNGSCCLLNGWPFGRCLRPVHRKYGSISPCSCCWDVVVTSCARCDGWRSIWSWAGGISGTRRTEDGSSCLSRQKAVHCSRRSRRTVPMCFVGIMPMASRNMTNRGLDRRSSIGGERFGGHRDVLMCGFMICDGPRGHGWRCREKT